MATKPLHLIGKAENVASGVVTLKELADYFCEQAKTYIQNPDVCEAYGDAHYRLRLCLLNIES